MKNLLLTKEEKVSECEKVKCLQQKRRLEQKLHIFPFLKLSITMLIESLKYALLQIVEFQIAPEPFIFFPFYYFNVPFIVKDNKSSIS